MRLDTVSAWNTIFMITIEAFEEIATEKNVMDTWTTIPKPILGPPAMLNI